MGGIGSGHFLGRQRRELVERSFAIEPDDLLSKGTRAGTRGRLFLRAPRLGWGLEVGFQVWNDLRGLAVVVRVPPETRYGVELRIDRVTRRDGRHRLYFACPSAGHPADRSPYVSRLYMPPWTGEGFGCRTCHRLSYSSRQARRPETQAWFGRLTAQAAAWYAEQGDHAGSAAVMTPLDSKRRDT